MGKIRKQDSLRKGRFLGRLLAALALVQICVPAHSDAKSNPQLIASHSGASNRPCVQRDFVTVPLYFVKNTGQIDKKVKFYEKGRGHTIYFTEEGVYLSLVRNEGDGGSKGSDHDAFGPVTFADPESGVQGGSYIKSELQQSKPTVPDHKSEMVKLTPIGMRGGVEIVAQEPQTARINYFIGSNPEKWKRDIPTYRSVLYKEVYPGIDIKFYGTNQKLEYDIIVRPGADPSQVVFQYEGAETLEVDDNGNLSIKLKQGGVLVQHRPIVYQEIGGIRIDVEGNFKILNKSYETRNSQLATRNSRLTYGFDLASYDKKYALIIDPILQYSTYLGGTLSDSGGKIAVDAEGNVYVAGSSESYDFPMASPFRGSLAGSRDIIVCKFNSKGNELVYSTYFGGSDFESGGDIAVDGDGNVYVVGSTCSTNLPVSNAFQASLRGDRNAFLFKLNASGSGLIYSTYLGGTVQDEGYGVAVDSDGAAYVVGSSGSTDFPVYNAFQENLSTDYGYGMDAFVTKFSPSGTTLVYSTYLGGILEDIAFDIAVDTAGSAYVVGYSGSTDFPVCNAFKENFSSGTSNFLDAFVTKFNPSGSALVYSTYLGGNDDNFEGFPEQARGVTVDSAGHAYVTGATCSSDFPTTTNACQTSYGGGAMDAFVTKFSVSGTTLVYSTYLGGGIENNSETFKFEFGTGISIDPLGNAYVTGLTSSTDFPTTSDAYQGSYGGGDRDAFVTKIDPSGTSLLYSTYMGGGAIDNGNGIATNTKGDAYVIGSTGSFNFPVVNAYQKSYGGGDQDAFVAKIDFDCTAEATPTVDITYPQDGSLMDQLFLVEGTASDPLCDVYRVELQITDGTYYVDQNQLFTTDSNTWVTVSGTSPWSFNTSGVNWDAAGPSYTITARATNSVENSTDTSITFTYGLETSSITCDISTNSIILGEPLTVSGQISPAPTQAGAFVDVALVSASSGEVHRSVVANVQGEFTYDLECEDIYRDGQWTVQTSWAGDEGLQGATSAAQDLTVSKAETQVTLDVTSQAIKIDEPVSISGKFTPIPDCGGDLSGLSLFLVISGTGGPPDIIPLQTDSQYGHFLLEDYVGFDTLGEWTIQAVFSGNDAYVGSAADSVQVGVVETAGYAIVVQGKASSEEGEDSHKKTTDFVYSQLKGRGLLDEDIMYFNYDYDPHPLVRPEIDASPSKTAIQDAITIWARDKMDPDFIYPDPESDVVGKPANLYIIFVDHGFDEVFKIYPQEISSTELGSWLNDLQSNLTGTDAEYQEIIAILGFCRSGSFIDNLYGDNRVIIASAGPGESSYKGPLDEDGIREGEYFISEFFKEAAFGKSVKECFEHATTLTEIFTASGTGSANAPYYDDSLQHPLLDDDGDGIGSNELSDPDGDGFLSENLFIGVSTITGNDPGDVIVTQVAESQFLGTGADTVDLWAKVDDNSGFSTIWVEVKPPDFVPVDAGGTGQAYLNLTKTPTTYHNSSLNRWEWTNLGGFTDSGTYQVFYFAKDNVSGNVSPLMETRVYKQTVPNQTPYPFSIISPADQASVLTTTVLDWEDTTDPDGDNLTYTVLLSKGNASFSNPIRIESLKYSTYLIGPSDGMEDLSNYYWKVQAIDEYGAIEESGVSMFSTNNTNPLMGWIAGHVYNLSTDQPITGGEVAVGSYVLNTCAGGYYLGVVPPGNYTITATASGYELFSIPDFFIPEGDLVTGDFGLEPSTVNKSMPWLMLLLDD